MDVDTKGTEPKASRSLSERLAEAVPDTAKIPAAAAASPGTETVPARDSGQDEPQRTGEPGEADTDTAAEAAAGAIEGEASGHRRLGPRALMATALAVAALGAATAAHWRLSTVQAPQRTQAGLFVTGGSQQQGSTRQSHARDAAPPAAAAPLPDIRLELPAGRITTRLGTTTRLPVAIDRADAVPKGSFVLVRGMPERAMLSSGNPLGAGTWLLKPDALSSLDLTIFAATAVPPRIAVELLSEQGEVIAKAETTVVTTLATENIRPPAAPRQDAASPVTFPPLKAEAAAAARGGERPAKSDRPAATAPRTPRQAERAGIVPRPAAAPPKQLLTGAAPQPQPKSKTAWRMNWDNVSYGR